MGGKVGRIGLVGDVDELFGLEDGDLVGVTPGVGGGHVICHIEYALQ
jgi:hypothetical protein